jgi:2-dehydropantoate 2-reductase
MRFLCFGVGAIGTYIGGSLALAGHEVVFVERPAVAEEVRRRGLSIERADGTTGKVDQPAVVENVEQARATGRFDAGILAVKSFDTQSVVDGLILYSAALPPIISFQNGVENELLLAAALGDDKVIPGTVTTAVGRKGPGDIVVERLRGIGIATNHPLGASLVPLLDAAGLRARGYPNPAAMKWSKMVSNLNTNASSAILNMTPAEIYANPKLYHLEARQLREALRVMEAMNIPVVDLPSTPMRLLAFIVNRLPEPAGRALLARSIGKGRGGKMPSFHIDLHSGRGKSEVEYLNGAVVRYGRRHHVATPVNQALTEILQKMTAGTIPTSEYDHQPDKLLAQIPED